MSLPVLLGLLVIWLFHISVYGDARSPVDNTAIETVPGIVMVVVVALGPYLK